MEQGYFIPLAIALGLGLLVGMQREHVTKRIAGIRTFPLITLMGSLTAILAQSFSGWIVAAGLLAVALVLFMGNIPQLTQEDGASGVTTEMAALVMFGVGAMLIAGYTGHALALGGAVAVLLHWKEPLHRFVDQIGQSEFRAVFQLALIGLVILPILPDRTYGWYDVLNPYRIWLMVVLISGISVGAYIAYKLLGARVGAVLGGVLGGLISSTATTVSYARHSRAQDAVAPMAALVIMLASMVMTVRVLFEIGLVAPGFLTSAAPPLLLMMALMLSICGVFASRVSPENVSFSEAGNPAQLKAAIVFGALYAVVLFAVAAAETHFGAGGMYAVALISGLTDMDAITLSTAEMVKTRRVPPDTGWRIVLLASMSNLVFKASAVALIGNRRLLRLIALMFGIVLAGGGLVLAFWGR